MTSDSNALRMCLLAMIAIAVAAGMAQLSPTQITVAAASVEAGPSGGQAQPETLTSADQTYDRTCHCPPETQNADCKAGPCSAGDISAYADLFPPLVDAARASPATDTASLAREPALQPPRLRV